MLTGLSYKHSLLIFLGKITASPRAMLLFLLRIMQRLFTGLEANIPSSSKTISFFQSIVESFLFWGHSGKRPAKILIHWKFALYRGEAFLLSKERVISSPPLPLMTGLSSLSKDISNNLCRFTFPSLLRSNDTIALSPANKITLSFSFLLSFHRWRFNTPSTPDAPLTSPMSHSVTSFRAVQKTLFSLDTSKTYGPNGIHPRVLEGCA